MYVHRLACIKMSDIRFDYIWTEFAKVLSPKLSTVHIHQNFTLKIFTTKDFTMQYSSTNWNSVERFIDICKYGIDVYHMIQLKCNVALAHNFSLCKMTTQYSNEWVEW